VAGLLAVYKANVRAFEAYAPPAGDPGRLALIRPLDPLDWEVDLQPSGASHSESLGWDALGATVDVTFVPGNHLTMTAEPHVATLARHLRSLYEDALRSGP
jgi:thioesterase domain-containing protein